MNEDEIQIRRREEDENSTRERAAILGLRYLDTRGVEDTLTLVEDEMSTSDMHRNKMVPLIKGDQEVVYEFGVTTQTPESVLRTMRERYNTEGKNILFYLISGSGYKNLMSRYDPPEVVVYDDIKIANDGDADTLDSVSETLNSVRSEELFNFLVEQANRLNASDIHIENERDDIRVRMRVDGALHTVANLDKDKYRVIMGELASRSGISMAAEASQSGHMQYDTLVDGEPQTLNLRVETVPTVYGQDAVLRLFNFDTSLLNLDRLGMGERERAEVDEIISHPRGLVLLVGPTGSGKSTTLYSMLNALNEPSRKIVALEDPVEYSLPGISQIPINTNEGRSFADTLRSVLRIDPDVIMIGEIRDQDTARTAIQASITGHLVLSTYHSNSSSAAFSRMIDMIGVNPIFSSSIRLVIAQRLVRRLVDDTKEEYEPDEATKNYVRKVLSDLPDNIDKPDLDNFKLWRPVETEDAPFGYSGRMILMEQMVVNEEIQKYIRGDIQDINPDAIEKTAKSQGMVTLEQAGVLAALRGETTLEEVNRVI